MNRIFSIGRTLFATRLWRASAPLMLSLVLLMSRAEGADAPLFAFVDGQGVVHITDRLGDVPEPYYSVYRAREVERQRQLQLQQKATSASADPAVTSDAPDLQNKGDVGDAKARKPAQGTEGQARARKQWQELMASWRKELIDSASALQAAEAEAQGANNPVLKETPAGRVRFEQARQRLGDTREKAMAAREMVMKVLPERAKREHVPPQWLAF